MRQKIKLLLFSITTALAVGVCFKCNYNFRKSLLENTPLATTQHILQDDDFQKMKPDSFTYLVKNAFRQNKVNQKKENGEIKLIVLGLKNNHSLFYNHNENLLKQRREEFNIKEDNNHDSLWASFKVYSETGVNYIKVPNDIIIGLSLAAY